MLLYSLCDPRADINPVVTFFSLSPDRSGDWMTASEQCLLQGQMGPAIHLCVLVSGGGVIGVRDGACGQTLGQCLNHS